MKKMMSMAFAAVMGMMMSGNAMANSVAPTNPAEMEAMISVDRSSISEVLETRTMIHIEGERTNKFVYVLNADGVIKSKTMYTYNNNTNEWMPVCVYRAVYGEDNNKIVCGHWNPEDNSYSKDISTVTYSKSECPVLFKLPEIINY